MGRKDITGKSHWDSIYCASREQHDSWRPRSYTDLVIEHFLAGEITKAQPLSILEIGCGNSTWLPFLARRFGVKAFGIDYSEAGCELARSNLKAAGVSGVIFCEDILRVDPAVIGTFDFVYSLGLVEHFSSLDEILPRLWEFVRPGGTLVTEIPNLRSIHGLMAYLYQPGLLSKHRIISRRELEQAHVKQVMENITSSYEGLFTPGIVAWGIEQRFPRLDIILLPIIRTCSRIIDGIMLATRSFKGNPMTSPFIYVAGAKRQNNSGAVNG